MEIKPEWIGVGLTAATSAGALFGWLFTRMDQSREVQPIVIMRRNAMQIINRSSEPLFVTQINCDKRIYLGERTNNGFGPDDRPVLSDTPINPKWEVRPYATEWFTFSVENFEAAIVHVRVSSSLRTIRNKRIVAIDKTTD